MSIRNELLTRDPGIEIGGRRLDYEVLIRSHCFVVKVAPPRADSTEEFRSRENHVTSLLSCISTIDQYP